MGQLVQVQVLLGPPGKITSNKEMEEFCLGVTLLLMGVKASNKDKAFYKQVTAF